MGCAAGDPARAALDARVLAWMREPAWREEDARFEQLALEIFAFQFEHCAAYGRFCRHRGRTPTSTTSWREIPAVPTGAFKELELRCFPAERMSHTFRTSGTATERRGALHLDTLSLYEASLLPSFRRHVVPDLAEGDRTRIRVLAPPAEELPESSLSHMFSVVVRELGDAASGFDVRAGVLDVEGLLGALEAAIGDHLAVTLCGTAFAFVHLLDKLAARDVRIPLPAGSRIMETGGFKGRSRELSREALHGGIVERLGVAPDRILNQYGMTELGSQFYDSNLRLPGEPRRKLGPPWTRVRVLDSTGSGDAAPGELGALVVHDLANTGSVAALHTADLGRRIGDGFEVMGREPGAEARGCSIAADELLAGAGP